MGVVGDTIKEFREFLEQYRILGLAVAFIIGAASSQLVQSLVNNIIMPLINPLTPEGAWQNATLTVGPIKFGWGAFLSSFVNFLIIAVVVFILVKKLPRPKPKEEPKPAEEPKKEEKKPDEKKS